MRLRKSPCWVLKKVTRMKFSRWKKQEAALALIGVAFLVIIARNRYKCGGYPVPDVVHMYYGTGDNLSSLEMACLRSALALQPTVYLHTNRPESLRSSLKLRGGLRGGLTVVGWEPSPAVANDTLFEALRILSTYGGIFVGNDVYLLKNLDEFRCHETTVSMKGGEFQAVLFAAHRASQVLGHWLTNYSMYRQSENSFSFPTESVHAIRDAVIPVFKDSFFIPNNINTDRLFGIQLK